MLKQSWKSSNYQIKNRKVNCYSSSRGLKQWSCIKGNFTVNAMEGCQRSLYTHAVFNQTQGKKKQRYQDYLCYNSQI